MPYSISELYSDYYPGGSYANSLTGDYAEADWAWHNNISNGNGPHLWRTLTINEWNYIINSRLTSTVNGTTNAHYAKATIASVPGVILFPDTYVHPDDVAQPNGINNGSNGYDINDYDLNDWELIEACGAVFLPVTYFRYGWGVDSRVNAHYWSTTPRDQSTIRILYFSPTFLGAGEGNYIDRFDGVAVRPVQANN